MQRSGLVLQKQSGTYGETGVADLSPAKEVEEAMDAGQLTAHQPFPLHHATRLPAVEVVDGGHHHHVCGGEARNQTVTDDKHLLKHKPYTNTEQNRSPNFRLKSKVFQRSSSS